MANTERAGVILGRGKGSLETQAADVPNRWVGGHSLRAGPQKSPHWGVAVALTTAQQKGDSGERRAEQSMATSGPRSPGMWGLERCLGFIVDTLGNHGVCVGG